MSEKVKEQLAKAQDEMVSGNHRKSCSILVQVILDQQEEIQALQRRFVRLDTRMDSLAKTSAKASHIAMDTVTLDPRYFEAPEDRDNGVEY